MKVIKKNFWKVNKKTKKIFCFLYLELIFQILFFDLKIKNNKKDFLILLLKNIV
jgi:hypothetical protein